MEQTIYTGHFDTLGDLQSELEELIKTASAARKARNSNDGDVHPDEIQYCVGTIFLEEEELTDGSFVYNFRIV